MTIRPTQNKLFSTFLHDALGRRGSTIEHLADLLAPVPESEIRSWFDGESVPACSNLESLADALGVNAVELTAGWMIAQRPSIEADVRALVLDPTGSGFPRSTDLHLRAARPRTDMNVGDPHDARPPSNSPFKVRKRASGAR